MKVKRNPNGEQDVMQFGVQILLEGNKMDEVYLTGDNAKVIATDTCKNTIYCLANKYEFDSIEEFGIIVSQYFLTEHPDIVDRINLIIVQDNWERLVLPDSRGNLAPHKHAFKRTGPSKNFANIHGCKGHGSDITVKITSGFRGFDIMKTTQTGFVGFNRDQYTSLPEATDRLLGTSVDAEWEYNTLSIKRGTIKFAKTGEDVKQKLIEIFAGPSDVGVYSASVQQTLFDMAKAVIDTVPVVTKVTLEMPNIHNLAFPLEKYGMKNADHTGNPTIFYPIDEPHGMIKATVERTLTSRL